MKSIVTILSLLVISTTVFAGNNPDFDELRRAQKAGDQSSDQGSKVVVDANGRQYILTPINSQDTCELHCRPGTYPNYSACRCEGD